MEDVFIDAKIADQIIENEFAKSDPFNRSWNEISDFRGLNKNFKRKVSRVEKANSAINNVPRGADGQIDPRYLSEAKAIGQSESGDARSKRINPGQVYRNGYGIFDLITPPYNLYELSSFYDTSFANHAAIDTKVSNSVGLGYQFDMTTSTTMKLEAMESDSAKQKAKKRIEQLKIQLQSWLENLNDDESLTKTLEKIVTDMQATGNGYIEVGRTVAGEIGYVGHVPSVSMRVRRLHDGYIQIVAGTITYFRNFGATNSNPVTEDPRPNEIIHLKE